MISAAKDGVELTVQCDSFKSENSAVEKKDFPFERFDSNWNRQKLCLALKWNHGKSGKTFRGVEMILSPMEPRGIGSQ